LKSPFVQRLLSYLTFSFLKVLGISLRWRFTDQDKILSRQPKEPIFFLFWHNRLLLIPYFFSKYMPDREGTAMVSPSKDGEFLSMTLKLFNINAARGSSSRKGVKALFEIYEAIRLGHDIAITPDGPRGPCYSMQPGGAAVAQQTGILVVPIGYRARACWKLKTWDRFIIPKPLSIVDVQLGKSFRIPPGLPPDEAILLMRQALESVTDDH